MIYNRFIISTLIRVILISVNSFLIVYIGGMEKRLFSIIFLLILLLSQIWFLFKYVSKTNRDLAKFLFYLKHSDTSLHFSTHQIEKIFKDLSKSFNQIIGDVQQIKLEKEEKELFLQTTVEHIGIGIISYDENGKVYIFNKTASNLLGIQTLRNIQNLDNIQNGLFKQIKGIKTGEPSIIKFKLKNQIQQYSINSIITKTEKHLITLLSIQDIKTELEENELQSYQKLIRVMTHEMMNSLTPITTLTTSIKRSFRENDHIKTVKNIDQETIDDAYTSSELIEERSRGLIDFIQKYRTLTKLPIPQFKACNVSQLFDKISNLLSEDMNDRNIKLELESVPESAEIMLDENLISQVLINLLKNAMDAVQSTDEKRIRLKSTINEQGKSMIEVSDSGIGIDDDLKEDIFIPFFTTKEHGTGIGLNFCRQVMRLHKGAISPTSKKGEGSTFTLEF